jgi:hypothetical protein
MYFDYLFFIGLLKSEIEEIEDGLPIDFSPQLSFLFNCTQLLLKELRKCRILVVKFPLDMDGHNG